MNKPTNFVSNADLRNDAKNTYRPPFAVGGVINIKDIIAGYF